jgi:prophage regulatory protein
VNIRNTPTDPTRAGISGLPEQLEQRRLLRLPEVRAAVGLGTATIYLRIGQGTFPAGILLSPRCRRWPAHEITSWLEACEASASQAKGAKE